MSEARQYDPILLDALHERQRVEDIDGVPTLMKIVPDDDRPNCLDPRVKKVVERKHIMFAQRHKATRGRYSLANERWRPDKVTYDLVDAPIDMGEQLIDVNGTHKIDVYTYRRADMAGEVVPSYIFIHGGGYTAGNEHLYHNQMRYLAEQSGALVIFPDYRLAPEAPFPAAVDDCWATVRWVHQNAVELGVNPTKIMVGGDSAGGSLSAACALKDEEAFIAHIFLLYPGSDNSDYRTNPLYTWSYDHYDVLPEHKELAYGRIDRIRSGCDGITDETSLYTQGHASLRDPLISAVFAADEQFAKFPPTTVAYSEFDYLRVSNEYLAKRLIDAGRDVRVIRYCGCDHGFMDFFGSEPQAEDVCLEMVADLKSL